MQVYELIAGLKKMDPMAYVVVCEKDGNILSGENGYDAVGYCEIRNSSDLTNCAFIIFKE